MDAILTKTSLDLNLAQIAWVVKDINTTLKFFQDVLGMTNFSEVVTIRVKDYQARITVSRQMASHS